MLSLATEASELLKQRRYTESRAAYLRLSNLPLFADQGYLGLGLVALRIGDAHAARWYFLHALRCNPGYAAAHAALAHLEGSQPHAGPAGWQPTRTAPLNATGPRGGVPVTGDRTGFPIAGARPAAFPAGGAHSDFPTDGPPIDGPAADTWRGIPQAGGIPSAPPAGARRRGLSPTDPDRLATPPGDLGSYEYLRTDTSLLAQHVTATLTRLPGQRHGNALAHAGRLIGLAAGLGALGATIAVAGQRLDVDVPPPSVLWAIGCLIWAGAVMRIRTTVFDLSAGRLTIQHGLLWRRVAQLELWQVRSIERRRTLTDRLTGHGELVFTAETADRQVLRARGLARKEQLRALHASLSDLVFLLRSCPPQTGALQTGAPQPRTGWPVTDTKPVGRQATWHTRATTAVLPTR